MNQESTELALLRRQNKRLTVLLVVTLLVALVAAAASVIAVMTLSAYVQEVEGTLTQLDEIMDGLTTLSDLVTSISNFFS